MASASDNFVDYLSQQARSDAAVVHEFKLRWVAGAETLHLFFEGEEDPAFYVPEIRRRTEKEAWPYICDGKPKLRAVRQALIDEGYLASNCLFFVDRDFDDFFGTQVTADDQTFITEPYSIENYLVSLTNAEVVLIELAGLERSDPEFRRIRRKFDELAKTFARKCRPLLALCLAYRASGGRPNLNNASMAKVFRVGGDLTLAVKPSGYSEFKRAVFPAGAAVSFGDARMWVRRLDLAHRQRWLRGKFELWFFQQLLLGFLRQTADERKSRKQRMVRVPVSLQSGAMFELLGGRIQVCPTLDRFLVQALERAAA